MILIARRENSTKFSHRFKQLRCVSTIFQKLKSLCAHVPGTRTDQLAKLEAFPVGNLSYTEHDLRFSNVSRGRFRFSTIACSTESATSEPISSPGVLQKTPPGENVLLSCVGGNYLESVVYMHARLVRRWKVCCWLALQTLLSGCFMFFFDNEWPIYFWGCCVTKLEQVVLELDELLNFILPHVHQLEIQKKIIIRKFLFFQNSIKAQSQSTTDR